MRTLLLPKNKSGSIYFIISFNCMLDTIVEIYFMLYLLYFPVSSYANVIFS